MAFEGVSIPKKIIPEKKGFGTKLVGLMKSAGGLGASVAGSGLLGGGSTPAAAVATPAAAGGAAGFGAGLPQQGSGGPSAGAVGDTVNAGQNVAGKAFELVGGDPNSKAVRAVGAATENPANIAHQKIGNLIGGGDQKGQVIETPQAPILEKASKTLAQQPLSYPEITGVLQEGMQALADFPAEVRQQFTKPLLQAYMSNQQQAKREGMA